jgi:hypothetical protein
MLQARTVSELSRGKIDPISPIIDTRIDEDGSDNRVGRDRNAIHAIHQVFQHEAQILFAPREGPMDARVAIDGMNDRQY